MTFGSRATFVVLSPITGNGIRHESPGISQIVPGEKFQENAVRDGCLAAGQNPASTTKVAPLLIRVLPIDPILPPQKGNPNTGQGKALGLWPGCHSVL